MEPIFLIVGGPAVGKSTASRALAGTFPRGVHIPVDNLRDMVVSGQALPGPEWPDELVLQIRLARETAVGMALRYATEGFTVVIDDFIDPNGLVEYAGLHTVPTFHAAVLWASEEEMHRRTEVRSPGAAGEYIHRAIGRAATSWPELHQRPAG